MRSVSAGAHRILRVKQTAERRAQQRARLSRNGAPHRARQAAKECKCLSHQILVAVSKAWLEGGDEITHLCGLVQGLGFSGGQWGLVEGSGSDEGCNLLCGVWSANWLPIPTTTTTTITTIHHNDYHHHHHHLLPSPHPFTMLHMCHIPD